MNIRCEHNGKIFSLKKDGNSDTTWMNLEDIVKTPVAKGRIQYDSTYVRYLK